MKNNWKARFRKLWSNINKENQHLTTERIEDLIEDLLAEQKKEIIEEILKHKLIVGQDFDGKQIYGVYINDIESLKNHD